MQVWHGARGAAKADVVAGQQVRAGGQLGDQAVLGHAQLFLRVRKEADRPLAVGRVSAHLQIHRQIETEIVITM